MVANRKADRIAAETKLAVELSQLDATLDAKIDRFMARFDFPSRVTAQRTYYRCLERLS